MNTRHTQHTLIPFETQFLSFSRSSLSLLWFTEPKSNQILCRFYFDANDGAEMRSSLEEIRFFLSQTRDEKKSSICLWKRGGAIGH